MKKYVSRLSVMVLVMLALSCKNSVCMHQKEEPFSRKNKSGYFQKIKKYCVSLIFWQSEKKREKDLPMKNQAITPKSEHKKITENTPRQKAAPRSRSMSTNSLEESFFHERPMGHMAF